MKTDLFSDEYIYELASSDVVTWKGAGENVGYKIADVPAEHHASLYIPSDVPKSYVSRFSALSTKDRVLIQEYFPQPNGLATRFRFINSLQINETYRNDPEWILRSGKGWFQLWGINVPIDICTEENLHNAAYDPLKEVVLINPTTMYKHMSRSAIFSRIPMKIALYFVMAHEAGHTLCDELRTKYTEFKSVVRQLNGLGCEGRFDSKLYSKYHEMLMLFEQNAWNLGKRFIPAEFLEAYEHNSNVMLNAHNQERAWYMIRSIIAGELMA